VKKQTQYANRAKAFAHQNFGPAISEAEGQDVNTQIRAAIEFLKENRPSVLRDIYTRKKSDAGLSPIRKGAQVCKEKIEKKPVLIQGVLRKGSKLQMSSSSKNGKTWILMNLGMAVANGCEWLGFQFNLGRVLYINLELSEATFRERLEECICAKIYEGSELEGLLENFDHWTLRNRAEAYDIIIPKIIEAIESEGYDLVIIDPIYKILGDLDENKAGDITKLMNQLGRAAERTGASIAFAHHFSKGNKAETQKGDRSSGSGVFARDPDAIIELVDNDGGKDDNQAFSVVAMLREFPYVPEFSVRSEGFGYFERDASIDPNSKRGARGRKKAYSEDMLVETLKQAGTEGLDSDEFAKRCNEDHGMQGRSFETLRSSAKRSDMISYERKDGKTRWYAVDKSKN